MSRLMKTLGTVKVPLPIYRAMLKEAEITGLSMQDIVRVSLAVHYRDLLFDADLAREVGMQELRANVPVLSVLPVPGSVVDND